MKKDMIVGTDQTIEQAYKNFILKKKHPCIMANTVFLLNEYTLKIYDDITSDAVVVPMLQDIERYLETYDFETNNFETLMFCFEKSNFTTEEAFEEALWNLLQKLHNADDVPWDATVSQNPNDADFSFSLKGKAFYIVGLHPQSSRLARQAPYCTVVLNLHWQFEKLREMGTYQSVKQRIRRRDKKLQGFINPVLKDFGKDSETKQYSGRNVERAWQCPFHPKPTA